MHVGAWPPPRQPVWRPALQGAAVLSFLVESRKIMDGYFHPAPLRLRSCGGADGGPPFA
jgi:hypothetical protein